MDKTKEEQEYFTQLKDEHMFKQALDSHHRKEVDYKKLCSMARVSCDRNGAYNSSEKAAFMSGSFLISYTLMHCFNRLIDAIEKNSRGG